MRHLTENKPKCLVSIGGQPILNSISVAFGPKLKYIIIADYKSSVLETYLNTFPPPFEYDIVRADGYGTASGIESARNLSGDEGFVLVWSDLLFTEKVDFSGVKMNSVAFTTENTCRWSIFNKKIVEEPNSLTNHLGIPGLFFFPKPGQLPKVPSSGEFVKYLAEIDIPLDFLEITGIKEIGSFEAYRKERDKRFNSRFFNNVHLDSGRVVKEAKTKQFDKLVLDEIGWYKFVSRLNFDNIPNIISYEPLTMDFIDGYHPFECVSGVGSKDCNKNDLLNSILSALQDLHNLGSTNYSVNTSKEVFIKKTIDRITKISGIIPHIDSDFFIVDGKKVMNLLHPTHYGAIEHLVDKVLRYGASRYTVIHGDPTFSNIMIQRDKRKTIFIDPRGYFGDIKIFGDPLYDYAKLYYSAVGNYDFFNQGRFYLRMSGKEVEVKVESEGFEKTEEIFENIVKTNLPALRLLHSLIWLSLSGYVIDDYDAILGSFFRGLKLFQEVWDEYA